MKRVAIKICGLKTEQDTASAVEAGADMLGFNFYPPSPRFIQPQAARDCIRCVPAHVKTVGVFVNDPVAQVIETVQSAGLQVAQWVGDGDHPAGRMSDRPWILAYRVRHSRDVERVQVTVELLLKEAVPLEAIIVDAFQANNYGGTGQTVPWNLLQGFRPAVPWFLAGGLTPENVPEAIRSARPDGVDVASGVESAPGIKDVHLMRRFVDAVRSAG